MEWTRRDQKLLELLKLRSAMWLYCQKLMCKPQNLFFCSSRTRTYREYGIAQLR